GLVFVALAVLFAVTPSSHTTVARGPESTSEPTPGPHECFVCGIDQECNPSSGQCMFVDHTPLPCVESAHYDDKSGFCLPEGEVQAPAGQGPANGVRTPGPVRVPNVRQPRRPHGGIFGN